MYRARLFSLIGLAGSVLFAACNTSAPSGPTITEWEGDFDFDFADPAADTLTAAGSQTSQGLDLLRVEGSMRADSIIIRLVFVTPVTRFTQGGATTLRGFIDFDIDEMTSSGIPSILGDFGGSANLGVDIFVALQENLSGFLPLTDVASGVTSFARLELDGTGTIATVAFSRDLLRLDDGNVRMAVLVGQGDRPATDLGPNAQHYVIHRP